MPQPTKDSQKSNQELILELLKEIQVLKRHIIDLNYRMPERKINMWGNGYWEMNKMKQEDWEKLQ